MYSQGSQSQDLEARFAVFLNPIRDLTKNWDIDIAKYLEDYLEELSHIQITFDGGRTVMNFAEAAMLIQGSTTVYSKKVEFLWQMVLQMLDLLSSKRALEKGSGAPIGGRRRSTLVPREFEEVNDLPIGKNIEMKEGESEAEQHKGEFKFLPAQPLHLMERQRQRGRAQIALFLKNMESFGHKDDFRINRSYMNPEGFLCLHIPENMLKKGRRLSSDLDTSLAGFLTPLPALNSSSHEKAPLDRSPIADDGVDHGGGGGEFPDSDEDANSTPVGAYPPPPAEVGQPKEEDHPKVADQPRIQRCGLRRGGAVPKELLANAMLVDPLKPLDPHLDTPAPRPIRAVRLKRGSRFKVTPQKIGKERKPGRREPAAPAVPSVESFIMRDLVDLVRRQEKSSRKGAALDPRLVTELVREEARRCAGRRDKWKPTPHVIGDDGEERPPSPLCPALEDEAPPDLDLDEIGPQLDGLDLPDPHPSDGGDDPIHTPFGAISSAMDGWGVKGGLNDSLLYEPGSEYEALVQKWISDVVTSAQDQVMSSDLTQRVNDWRKRIIPRLQQEEQRTPFDIHQCGSEILALFPEVGEDGSSPTMPFADLARGHEAHRVSRLFLSCLMLANSYNVELSQTVEGDLEMDVLRLRLLSRDRQLHHMEEYAPPSALLRQPPQRDLPPRPSTSTRKSPRRPAPSNARRGSKRKKAPSSSLSSTEDEIHSNGSSASSNRKSPRRPAPSNAHPGAKRKAAPSSSLSSSEDEIHSNGSSASSTQRRSRSSRGPKRRLKDDR